MEEGALAVGMRSKRLYVNSKSDSSASVEIPKTGRLSDAGHCEFVGAS
jgi:hypothetical protein